MYEPAKFRVTINLVIVTDDDSEVDRSDRPSTSCKLRRLIHSSPSQGPGNFASYSISHSLTKTTGKSVDEP